jgi:hypothetical protein
MRRILLGSAACAAALAAAASVSSGIWYVDEAALAGLTIPNTYGERDRKTYILETTGNGAGIVDVNNDGWNDIFIVNGRTLDAAQAKTLPQLYLNDGAGKFAEVGERFGFTKQGWGQGVCAGDYDNNGWTDLAVTYYGHNVLYRNRKGRFEDVTAQAKMPNSGSRWGSGCAWLDYDRDGFLDLFVSNYVDLVLEKTPKPGESPNCQWKGLAVMCGPTGLPKAQNLLYRNNGDGTFTDVSKSAGILKEGGSYGLGVLAADFDNDGWTDIYVACDMTPSLLYRNTGKGRFEEAGIEAGVAFNVDGRLQAGMGVAATDYDGNGFLDLAKTNFSGDLPSLYNNEDGRFFTDVSQHAGLGTQKLLGWGVAFVDADEDGWQDLLIANGHVYPEVDRAQVGDRYRQQTQLFRNLGGERFEEWSDRAGPAFKILRPARGLATGDLDGDGHPEIVVVNMNEPPALLRNTGQRRNAIVLKLIGTESNRDAIGARVTISSGGLRQVRQLISGGSYYSQNDLALHFGLGDKNTIELIRIAWPNGKVQEWKYLQSNFRYVMVEGDREYKQAPLRNRSGPASVDEK